MWRSNKRRVRPQFQVDLPLADGEAVLMLPSDLTQQEATKICDVIMSLAKLTDRE